MTRIAAITINRPEDEVRRRWPGVEPKLPPLHGGVRLHPAPGGRGTEVRIPYEQGGIAQRLLAVTGRDRRRVLEDALRRFKQVLETGQVVRSEASPQGTDAARQRRRHPARPVQAP
ncbi:MAG: hypothetical protein ACJ73E_07450 [Mycobacteriales bacterium]